MLSVHAGRREVGKLHFVFQICRLLPLAPGLALSLTLAACGTASWPKLGDYADSSPQRPAPAGPQVAGDVPLAPASPASGYAPTSSGLRADAPTSQLRQSGAGLMIVAFKAPTVVLFGNELGNEGERIAAASLGLPLQAKDSSANAGRVQIDTAGGPRWVARAEIVLAADGPKAAARPLQ